MQPKLQRQGKRSSTLFGRVSFHSNRLQLRQGSAEWVGSWSSERRGQTDLIISVSSGDDREVHVMFQRVSVVVQRFNSVMLHASFLCRRPAGPDWSFQSTFLRQHARLRPGLINNNGKQYNHQPFVVSLVVLHQWSQWQSRGWKPSRATVSATESAHFSLDSASASDDRSTTANRSTTRR